MDNIDTLHEIVQRYEHKRILWDPKHADYYNKSEKEDAWREISQNVNIPIKDLKRKMQSLTGSFRRERSRVKRSLVPGSANRSGADKVYRSKWFAYTWFQFLMNKDNPNNAGGTIEGVQKIERRETEETQDDFEDTISQIDERYSTPQASVSNSQDGDIVSTLRASASSSSNLQTSGVLQAGRRESTHNDRHLRKRRVDNDDIMLEHAYNILKQTTRAATDHYESFGNHVANELRKYDVQILPHVKKAILDVLFRADIGEFHKRQQDYARNSTPDTLSYLSSDTDTHNQTSPRSHVTAAYAEQSRTT